jgi:hypothetical protein
VRVRRRGCRCICKGPRPPSLRPPLPTRTALKSPPLQHTRRQSKPLMTVVLWAAWIPPGPNDPPCRRSETPAGTAPTAMKPPLQRWLCPGRSPRRGLRGRCQLPITTVPAGLQRLTPLPRSPLPRSPLPLPPQPHRFQVAIRGQCARPLCRRRPYQQQQVLRSRHRTCQPPPARGTLPPTPAPPRHPSAHLPRALQPMLRQTLFRQHMVHWHLLR